MSYSEKYTAKTWQNQASDGTIADDAPKMNASNIQTMDDGIEGAYKGLDEVKEYADSRIDNHIYFGTYEGNDEASQFIELGFTPKAVLVVAQNGTMTYQSPHVHIFGGLALQNSPVILNSTEAVTIENNGFKVYNADEGYDSINANVSYYTFNYIAFK